MSLLSYKKFHIWVTSHFKFISKNIMYVRRTWQDWQLNKPTFKLRTFKIINKIVLLFPLHPNPSL